MAVARTVLGRFDAAGVHRMPSAVAPCAEKARLITLMAGGAVAVLFDRQQDCVAITIDADFVHGLVIAGFLALAPQPIARAREVAGVAGAQSFLERFAVHIRDHQQPSALMVLGDGGDDASGLVKVDLRNRLSGGSVLRL